jgi:hypothetical protein
MPLPDFDCLIDGILLDEIVRIEKEFLIKGSSGVGYWEQGGQWWSSLEVTNVEAVFGLGDFPDVLCDLVCQQLEIWSSDRTPLRAAFTPTGIQLNDGNFALPLPRTPRENLCLP